jgi:hypothetical protein
MPSAAELRGQMIDALARRAAGCEGPVRARLEARLATLRAQAAGAENTPAPGSSDEPSPPTPAPSPLATLLEHIAQQAGPAPELKTLQRFRRTWSRLAADQRVVRSRTRLPDHAGPLNSQRLVHRALTTMRELSPDYLERFVAHADALLWLESAGGGDLLTGKDVLQAGAAPAKPKRKGRGKAG